MTNILEYLEKTVSWLPQKRAFWDAGEEVTFSQLYKDARAVGYYLYRRGIRREPVAVFMGRRPSAVAAMLGAVYAGGFYSVFSTELPQTRLEQITQVLCPKVIVTTCELLQSKSIADISLADIAAAAGISKGTLYYHYKTKNEVFLDITQHFLDEQWEDLIRWTENKEKDTSLNRLVRYVAERDIASAGLRLQLLAEAQMGNETLQQGLTTLYQNFQGLIRRKIAERTDLPADFLTWLLLLVCDGIIVQEAIGNAAFDREAFLQEGIQYLREMSAEKKIPAD